VEKSSLVVIPTFNEAYNAPVLIRRIFSNITDISILIVDDNSPDGTANRIKELMHEFPNLHLIERKEKSGLGTAYRTGFSWGLEHKFENLIEMDADLSHRVRDLKVMLESKNKMDDISLVIGSRWIKGGATENWPMSRELLSRFANLYVRIALWIGVKDSTSGFRVYDSEILRRINLSQIRSEGYSFQIEMTRAVHRLGGKIVEVPIIFRERENGVSKMSKAIVREAMLLVTAWGFKRILRIN
jgi:dolichol-phosphate mannosyltransferase